MAWIYGLWIVFMGWLTPYVVGGWKSRKPKIYIGQSNTAVFWLYPFLSLPYNNFDELYAKGTLAQRSLPLMFAFLGHSWMLFSSTAFVSFVVGAFVGAETSCRVGCESLF